MKCLVAAGLVMALVQAASGGMVISEWMYSGTDGEFIEFTNVGPDPVDMTDWSFDDTDPVPGTVDLSAFGVVAAGESVILTEVTAASFATAWGLSGVGIIGENNQNLGRADQINLYDAADNLIDQLNFGDQAFPGTVRTQNKSCNIPATDYGFADIQLDWVLAAEGDAYGSWMSSGGDIASPGQVPEPAALATLLLGALVAARRRA